MALEGTLGAMLELVDDLAPTLLVLTAAELEPLLQAAMTDQASGIFLVVTRGDMGLAATLNTEGDKAHI